MSYFISYKTIHNLKIIVKIFNSTYNASYIQIRDSSNNLIKNISAPGTYEFQELNGLSIVIYSTAADGELLIDSMACDEFYCE